MGRSATWVSPLAATAAFQWRQLLAVLGPWFRQGQQTAAATSKTGRVSEQRVSAMSATCVPTVWDLSNSTV
jgi:hypothetical protein